MHSLVLHKKVEVYYEQLVCILDFPQASELQASERQASKHGMHVHCLCPLAQVVLGLSHFSAAILPTASSRHFSATLLPMASCHDR